ncbi:MAG TPA: hypothetical protein VGH10_13555 [Actinomycetota bacterium]|jgi:hypothetical protein
MNLVPKGAQERLDTLLKEFEWTWTKAAVASFLLWLLAIVFIAVIPSWWLYFAGNTLHWTGPPTGAGGKWSFWLKQGADLVAIMLFSIPTGLFIVVPYFVQKQRRKLRGQDMSRASGGYR